VVQFTLKEYKIIDNIRTNVRDGKNWTKGIEIGLKWFKILQITRRRTCRGCFIYTNASNPNYGTGALRLPLPV